MYCSQTTCTPNFLLDECCLYDKIKKYIPQALQYVIYKQVKNCNSYSAGNEFYIVKTRKRRVDGGGPVWLCWCVLLLIRQPSKIPLSKGHFFSCRPPVGHRSDPWQLNKLSCSSISSFILWESEAHLSSVRRPRLEPPTQTSQETVRKFSGELDETWQPTANWRRSHDLTLNSL